MKTLVILILLILGCESAITNKGDNLKKLFDREKADVIKFFIKSQIAGETSKSATGTCKTGDDLDRGTDGFESNYYVRHLTNNTPNPLKFNIKFTDSTFRIKPGESYTIGVPKIVDDVVFKERFSDLVKITFLEKYGKSYYIFTLK